MIRARYDHLETQALVWLPFSAIDEPVYPMVGDKYRLYSMAGPLEYDAEVVMVNFIKSKVYLKVELDKPIDVDK